MIELKLRAAEALALKDTLDWLNERYGPVIDPILMDVRQKLRHAISG